MASTAARAFSLSLLECRCCSAVDGTTPTLAEVVADHSREVGGGRLPPGCPITPNGKHHGGVNSQFRSPIQEEAIDEDFQPGGCLPVGEEGDPGPAPAHSL